MPHSTVRFTSEPAAGMPKTPVFSGSSSTCMQTRKTIDWTIWVAAQPVKARHHIRAMPSVAGWPWQASISGAATVSTTTAASRTSAVTSSVQASVSRTRANTRLYSGAVAVFTCASSIPTSAAAAESALIASPAMAQLTALPRFSIIEQVVRDRLEAAMPNTSRGSSSRAPWRCCTVPCPITVIPPASTSSPYRPSASIRSFCHSSRTFGRAVTSGTVSSACTTALTSGTTSGRRRSAIQPVMAFFT
ncbi:hypothetical protein ACFQ1I_32945 [Kitasatospora arboriphila]